MQTIVWLNHADMCEQSSHACLPQEMYSIRAICMFSALLGTQMGTVPASSRSHTVYRIVCFEFTATSSRVGYTIGLLTCRDSSSIDEQ